MYFLNNKILFFSARAKTPITNEDKNLTPKPTPEPGRKPTTEPAQNTKVFDTPRTKRKISLLKLRERFLNEIANEEKNINNESLKTYF